jgi:antitoxin component YwqK of YwqJK toxin-antitoxin module
LLRFANKRQMRILQAFLTGYMKLNLTSFLVLGCVMLFAQELKQIKKESFEYTDTLRGGYFGIPIREVYTVLKSDRKIKHGSYVKYDVGKYNLPFILDNRKNKDENPPVLERGSYVSGAKSGTWEYYYHIKTSPDENASPGVYLLLNQLRERGQYANGKKNGIWYTYHFNSLNDLGDSIVSAVIREANADNIQPQTVHDKHLKVKSIGQYLNGKQIGEWFYYDPTGMLVQKYNFTKKKLLYDISVDTTRIHTNRNAVFIGGVVTFSELLNRLSIQKPDGLSRDSIHISLSLTIDREGKVSSNHVSMPDTSIDEDLARLSAMPGCRWAPAIEDGQAVASTYTFYVDFIRLPSVMVAPGVSVQNYARHFTLP